MTTRRQKPSPPSLVQMFEPPEGFVACFGWLCGFSADARFLKLTAERFAQQTSRTLAHAGRVYLGVMLDAGQAQIAPADAPGVLHLPPPPKAQRPYRLLHAKVAIVGFASEQDPEKWRVRLIVSTGNWTAQTLNESLDLAWCIELESTQRGGRDESARQARADIIAAWACLRSVRDETNLAPLGEAPGWPESESRIMVRRFDQWLASVSPPPRNTRPRFFDSRKSSLLAQLPDQVSCHAGDSARNYIAMGSGFFESRDATGNETADTVGVPSVLKDVVGFLQGQSSARHLLSAHPEVDVFVNPDACQGVATCANAIRNMSKWHIRPASAPAYFGNEQRFLHAKFVFSGFKRKDASQCSSAWLYLGSGNLTGPGFREPASPGRGNLEAGVVLSLGHQSWENLAKRLPMQWDTSLDDQEAGLAPGERFKIEEDAFESPPVSCLLISGEVGNFQLSAPSSLSNGSAIKSFQILLPGGVPIEAEEGCFLWPEARPRQVRVRWGHSEKICEAEVPVIDEFGRIAGTQLEALDLESAWSDLENFPRPPEIDDPDTEPDPDLAQSDADSVRTKAPSTVQGSAYPLRSLMKLIERIADQQVGLGEADWETWCMRLEQTLILAARSPEVAMSRQLKIPVLAALREAPFRPDFALDANQPSGVRYEQTLKRIEQAWQSVSIPSETQK